MPKGRHDRQERPVISTAGAACPKFSLRRLVPLVVIVVISVGVVAMGWHRQLSFETLARHHEALRDFIATHEASAVAAYVVALYRGGRAVGPGRVLSHGDRRDSVRRRHRRGGGAGGRDHRSDLHLPDRQERARRASRAPGGSAGGEARARLSRRRLQLSAVPAAGADLSVLAGQSGSGAARRAAGDLCGGDRARHHPRHLRLRLRRRRPRQRDRRPASRLPVLPRRRALRLPARIPHGQPRSRRSCSPRSRRSALSRSFRSW